MKQKPLSIENQWDVLYRDYPDVYEEFGRVQKNPTAIEVVNRHFPLSGKRVLDIGAGTGLSTFELGRYAATVIGLEPEKSMLEIATKSAREQATENVLFLGGKAEHLPLKDKSVDIAIAVTLASLYTEANVRAFASESERVTRKGGTIITVDIAPRWYGGDLAPVILGRSKMDLPEDNIRETVLASLDFKVKDFYTIQDYGTVEHAVDTYGFIFGKAAIDFLRANEKSVIKWKVRIRYKTL